jgi:hypothetical protein
MQKYKPSVNRLLSNLAGISNTFFIIMGFGELLLNKSYYFGTQSLRQTRMQTRMEWWISSDKETELF